MKVLVPEDIPSHNKGEAALLYGMLESLKGLGDFKLSLLSLNEQTDRNSYGREVEVVDSRGVVPAHIVDGAGGVGYKARNYLKFLLKNLCFFVLHFALGKWANVMMKRRLWQEYVDTDLILMSHDSFFAPFYHGILALVFRAMGKPTAIYAATVKPPIGSGLKAWLTNQFNAFALKYLPLITLREEMSFEYLKSLRVTDCESTKVEVLPDLAFLLPPVPLEEAEAIAEKEGLPQNGPIVGMAFAQRKLDFVFPHMPELSREERRDRAIEPLVKAVDYVTETLGATVVFVPHSIGPSDLLDDRITADWIMERAKNKGKLINIRNDYSPMQLKGLAGLMDMTVGARLHFAIDAMCMNVPSLLVTHDGDIRCHGIMGKMLGLEDYVYNIDQIDATSFVGLTARLWENRESMKGYLEKTIGRIKNLTYRHGELAKALCFPEGQSDSS